MNMQNLPYMIVILRKWNVYQYKNMEETILDEIRKELKPILDKLVDQVYTTVLVDDNGKPFEKQEAIINKSWQKLVSRLSEIGQSFAEEELKDFQDKLNRLLTLNYLNLAYIQILDDRLEGIELKKEKRKRGNKKNENIEDELEWLGI